MEKNFRFFNLRKRLPCEQRCLFQSVRFFFNINFFQKRFTLAYTQKKMGHANYGSNGCFCDFFFRMHRRVFDHFQPITHQAKVIGASLFLHMLCHVKKPNRTNRSLTLCVLLWKFQTSRMVALCILWYLKSVQERCNMPKSNWNQCTNWVQYFQKESVILTFCDGVEPSVWLIVGRKKKKVGNKLTVYVSEMGANLWYAFSNVPIPLPVLVSIFILIIHSFWNWNVRYCCFPFHFARLIHVFMFTFLCLSLCSLNKIPHCFSRQIINWGSERSEFKGTQTIHWIRSSPKHLKSNYLIIFVHELLRYSILERLYGNLAIF